MMHTKVLSRRQRFTVGLLAGLAAGVVATALMLLLSFFAGGVSLPEVLGSAITQMMSASTFSYLHQLIGPNAKYYLSYIIIAGQLLVFALSGGLCNLVASLPWPHAKQLEEDEEQAAAQRAGQLRWGAGVLLALVLWLFTGFVFLPLTGAGLFGAQLTIGLSNAMLSLAVVGLVFGLLFVLFQNWLALRRLRTQGIAVAESLTENASRRTVLTRGLQILGLSILGVIAWRFVTGNAAGSPMANSTPNLLQHFQKKITPPPVPNYGTIQQVPNLSPEITPNDQFYVVSKNLVSDPVVAASGWSLKVDGMVNAPYELSYQELMAMPLKQQYESLMCISNEVGGSYMSNAQWDGIVLSDLLSRAGGVKTGATKVVFYAVDDYSDSIHLSKALEPTTLLAVRMNGVTLPNEHGFPARMLVPGIYGMKHVKWINRIELVNTDYQGYWQQRGWDDAAPIRMTSRIDVPLATASLKANQPTYVAGVAFSGNQGISEVDVSFDNGQSWQRATLQRPYSDLTWVLWELPWQPQAGTYAITVRAVDLDGNVQDPEIAPPAPSGSSGYHTITVTVN
jgi:DMSO/TMAO reductase YedYZ molybdopterin-dependent catalytic subunit